MRPYKRPEKNRKKEYIVMGVVIVVKLILMGLFSSDYQDKMFMPFVSAFLQGFNPYSYYFEHELLPSFPYFPLMLLIKSIDGGVVAVFQPKSIFVRNLLFKMSLLIFDMLGYWFLRKMHVGAKYAIIFYSCSPITLYATFMHGQLDIIPTVLLLGAVYFVTTWDNRHNLLWYAVFLGLAIGTKFHIIAALPILFIYVASKRGVMQSLKYTLYAMSIVVLLTVGFWGKGFAQTVLMNKEQAGLTSVAISYGTTKLLIPIAVIFIIYAKTYGLEYFNRDLLCSLLGFLYAVFVICVPPMPAWFIWIVPYIALYFSFVKKDKYKTMILYGCFNVLYLAYFVFLHRTEYVDIYFLGTSLQTWKIPNDQMKYILFTLMATCLGMVICRIYSFGLLSNSLYKRGNIPFTIGIAGDSGTGKTKLLEKIGKLFGTDQNVLFIEGDGDHRWARNDENWERFTALDPQANYLYKQAEDIKALREGNHVYRSEYDHDTGLFRESQRVNVRKYIVLCGLHSLYLPQLRKQLDLKIFMDTDQKLQRYWKIKRDTGARGYTKEEIVAQINKRIPDAQKYIYPQKRYADIVITFFDKTLVDCYEDDHTEELSLRFDVDINIDLERVLTSFHTYGVYPDYFISGDTDRQVIVFDGKELLEHEVDYQDIAQKAIPQLLDLFTYRPNWGSDVEGAIQLFVLVMISRKMQEVS